MSKAGRGAGNGLRPLHVYSLGFWRGPRIARILKLAGWRITTGWPGRDGAVGIWGAAPRAWRGEAVARRSAAGIVRVEDAFLRSVVPGRARGRLARRGPLGLLIDPVGLHFDSSRPSLIEELVTSGATAGLETRAAGGIARLRAADLSKYNTHRPEADAPPPGHVLVIDQTRGDASLMGAGRATFLAMLAAARAEHPGRPLVIRSHPETAAGLRPGHLTADDLRPGEIFCDAPVSPWRLVKGAAAVYAVSSQLGYEALLAGHRPRLFGTPFYSGWDLSDDEGPPLARRGRASAESLFAASHLLAPTWYDPCRDALTDFEGALAQLEAETAAFRQDRDGHLAWGMRLWKRPGIARAFGQGGHVRFARRPSPDVTLAWANRADDIPHFALTQISRGEAAPAAGGQRPPARPLLRVEDGFLRSRGLGAELTPALSLVADDLGIYYDPTRPSRLEALVAAPLPPGGEARAEALMARLRAQGLSKYNLGGEAPALPCDRGPVILVPGQVEDDASIRQGASEVRTNLALLRATRQANPHAFLVWKPHPDVEAGLRPGAVAPEAAADLADLTALRADPAALLAQVDAVWTITSTLGFEALIRGVAVTTLGAPFYAGWGLTRDLGPMPERRRARPGLSALVHAALIAYPRYMDPVSGLPCPVEVALDRLAEADGPRGGPGLRLLAKAQGALASQSWLWR
ncbi:capsular polysaccharide biosynthesis protein [Paracoccus sp. S-4012]|uniref:capsular polysaccharide biosynthesis protein n=1 Tax=Paracoccus sp. S-4012 TaxID=2665648 RepID=UPI0012B0E2AF|nr:capsular polysaccharide biosynthesis protein [Paracoccus sp. S-4012]MRX51313.1 capsular polysaccharide biosynthesis protein [Paracoccus sp. S-4012]